MLVTGAFITGVVALTSVSQVNADTVTETQDAQPKLALTSKASDESNLPSAKQNQTNSVNTVETKETSANTTNTTTSSTSSTQKNLVTSATNDQVVSDKSSTNNTNVSATPVTSITQQVDNVTKEISTPDITIQGHGQDYGWQKPMHENQTVGVTEQSKRLEAVKISVANADKTYQGDVIYQAHLAGTGWQQEVKNGELAGTVHQGRQIEAIKIRLTGELANRYNIYYRAYVQNSGWSDWVANGNIAGTTGLGLRLEAIQFMLNLRHQPVIQSTNRTSVGAPNLHFQVQGQDYGWQNTRKNDEIGGTTGQGKRLEAIKINIENNNLAGDVIYQAHLAGTGWQREVKNGELAGTVGQSRQMEAIKVNLTGELANYYNIYYRVHIQGLGWLDWASNGNVAGSTGLGLRIEAIQFMLNLKEHPFTQSTQRPSVGAANLQYQVQGQDYGWQNMRHNNTVAGTTGQGKRLEAIKIYLDNNGLTGDVVYQVHVSGTGWQNEVPTGQLAGTVGQSRQMEAIKVNLTGELANYYNIYYRVHIQNVGWLDWTSNGNVAGSTGLGLRIEAVQIMLDSKRHTFTQSTKRPSVGNVNLNFGVDTNKTVQWFFDRQGKLTYSMYGSRNGTDGTADCSGAVTQAIYDAGGTKPEYLYSTETLHDYLKQNDYKLIALNQEWYAKKGDVVIWGKQGQSIGAAGHVSIISTNDPDAKAVSVNYLSKGKKGTAVTEEDYNHFAKISGWPYTYVYRHISNL